MSYNKKNKFYNLDIDYFNLNNQLIYKIGQNENVCY